MNKVTLPELGDGIEKATVACWHVQEGDAIEADQDIVELVTDKAAFNVPSETAGVVQEILVNEGEDAQIGQILALIEEADNS